jgi:NADH:ubiquinone oxidoreductase subunit B-like Fe-S oxidoreductase
MGILVDATCAELSSSSQKSKNKISGELPLSTRIFPMTHPAMFTSMTMASLWFMDFNLKSCYVNVIDTLAHSGRAAGPSLMIVF